MGWDGSGWDGMEGNGVGWDGMKWDGRGCDGMGWDASREAGANLWSVRLFGVSRWPGGRRKPLESPAGKPAEAGQV